MRGPHAFGSNFLWPSESWTSWFPGIILKETLTLSIHSQILVDLVNITSELYCGSCNSGSNRTSVRIAHRYGPCSPIASKLKPPTLSQILRQDQDRVNYLRWRISKGSQEKGVQSSEVSVPAVLGSSLSTAEYVATVGFGTPKLDQSIILDTGSDVSWIQCNCQSCYPQQQTVFDPSQSSTYSALSCDSTQCNINEFNTNDCSNNTCMYGLTYGDGSRTFGILSSDTLALSSDAIQGFVFGCGEINQGFEPEEIAGLMGLGRGPLSLVSQLSSKLGGGVFSYCLPPSPHSAGYLSFGTPQESVSYTPMVNTDPSHYYVQLIGISAGGQQLQIDASVFSAGDTVLDSGTIITRLPPTAYSTLRSAFQSYMSSEGYTIVPQPASALLDTCYDFNGASSVTVPTIALQFGGGATLNVEQLRHLVW